MKLQRTTWILFAIALGLGGFVYFHEIQGASRREAAQADKQQLFPFSEAQVEGLEIVKPTQMLKFERTGDDKNPWQMTQPEDTPASDPSVVFLLDLLAEGKSDRAFTIPRDRLGEYGLDKPLAEITIRVKDRPQPHQLMLGKPNFDEKFLYARLDPDDGSEEQLEVVLVPIDFKYAVERELSEWKQEAEDSEEEGEDEENREVQ